MTSTIKVNNIQNQCGANIANKCGTTITLGASGDTITLASGASQTGFGRTGTVDWDTTAKTASFTAVSGNGYFVNTTSGAITVTLPAGSPGDIVSLADYAATWQTNNVTVTPNGTDKIGGVNTSVGLSTEGQSVTFIYTDSTQGWLNTMDSTSNVRASAFIVATGGTITTCGNYKVHTFTSPGTFTVSATAVCAADNNVDYLVTAGGGGGGASCIGGGGGAGGFRATSTTYTIGCAPGAPLTACVSALPVSVTGYPITVGSGGAGGTLCSGGSGPTSVGVSGSNSVFSTITSAGGGGGSGKVPCAPPAVLAQPGGSGGGSDYSGTGGTGNTPPVSPPQGNPGGSSSSGTPAYGAAGGGGAIAAGSAGSPTTGGAGGAGAGVPNAFGTSGENCGSYYYFSGGGAGANECGSLPAGGIGGGGDGGYGGGGSPTAQKTGCNGITNTGGGGGGSCAPGPISGGNGGSGIVIIRYKYQ
jgi:hypothetical protein